MVEVFYRIVCSSTSDLRFPCRIFLRRIWKRKVFGNSCHYTVIYDSFSQKVARNVSMPPYSCFENVKRRQLPKFNHQSTFHLSVSGQSGISLMKICKKIPFVLKCRENLKVCIVYTYLNIKHLSLKIQSVSFQLLILSGYTFYSQHDTHPYIYTPFRYFNYYIYLK